MRYSLFPEAFPLSLFPLPPSFLIPSRLPPPPPYRRPPHLVLFCLTSSNTTSSRIFGIASSSYVCCHSSRGALPPHLGHPRHHHHFRRNQPSPARLPPLAHSTYRFPLSLTLSQGAGTTCCIAPAGPLGFSPPPAFSRWLVEELEALAPPGPSLHCTRPPLDAPSRWALFSWGTALLQVVAFGGKALETIASWRINGRKKHAVNARFLHCLLFIARFPPPSGESVTAPLPMLCSSYVAQGHDSKTGKPRKRLAMIP